MSLVSDLSRVLSFHIAVCCFHFIVKYVVIVISFTCVGGGRDFSEMVLFLSSPGELFQRYTASVS